jgi:hypothetical protein
MRPRAGTRFPIAFDPPLDQWPGGRHLTEGLYPLYSRLLVLDSGVSSEGLGLKVEPLQYTCGYVQWCQIRNVEKA